MNTRRKLTAVIEKTSTGFSGYLKEEDGIACVGDSIREIKEDFLDALKLVYGSSEEFEINYVMDLEQKFLIKNTRSKLYFKKKYKGVTKKIKKAHHYSSEEADRIIAEYSCLKKIPVEPVIKKELSKGCSNNLADIPQVTGCTIAYPRWTPDYSYPTFEPQSIFDTNYFNNIYEDTLRPKKFRSTKVFDGFSTVFRQHKAEDTHCRFLHGYGISFKVTFEGDLDERNWVWDFGGMKRAKTRIDGMSPKAWMDYMFDHTTIIAEDDPMLFWFKSQEAADLIQLRVIPATGAERFAEFIFNKLNTFVKEETKNRVRVTQVEFREHGKNSAIYGE